MASVVKIRDISPSDYGAIIGVIDEWWGGRRMAGMLPRLFFEHFADTSFAAERNGILAGFLVGFCSQSRPGEAYIHFAGVQPGERSRGLGRRLHETFFETAAGRGCLIVRAVTAPVNSGSVAFHRRMGFEIEPGDLQRDGIPVTADYDGPGQDRVRFVKYLRPLPDSGPTLAQVSGGEK
jgi:predicted GNAT superfamily acetyltransferase